jgi:hypothetical protein
MRAREGAIGPAEGRWDHAKEEQEALECAETSLRLQSDEYNVSAP